MNGKENRTTTMALGVSTAMAAVLLTGCAANPMPRAEIAAADAQRAMDHGQISQAVQQAELAVSAEPRNAAYRLMLGSAYLNDGRFASASTSFQDAMALGETSPRAALSLSLALTGEGRFAEAASLLRNYEGEIAAADLGLAYALAGQPERGIHILSNAVRQGQNNAKVRQNLAYAYAVAGRWRDARLMVAQDVPADQVGARMQEWAQLTHAGAYQSRVAGLLGAPAGVRDAGQPVHLALGNSQPNEQLAAQPAANAESELAANTLVAPVSAELPAADTPEIGLDTYQQDRSGSVQPAQPAVNFAEAFAVSNDASAALADVSTDASQFAHTPAAKSAAEQHPTPAPRQQVRDTQPVAAMARRAEASPVRAALAAVSGPVANASHLVQLGSFTSEHGARRAWDIYVSRHPELADHEMVITQAMVRGKRYWRVSASGFNMASSRSMCADVNSSANGEGCITWAASSPLPGAIDNGVRLARR